MCSTERWFSKRKENRTNEACASFCFIFMIKSWQISISILWHHHKVTYQAPADTISDINLFLLSVFFIAPIKALQSTNRQPVRHFVLVDISTQIFSGWRRAHKDKGWKGLHWGERKKIIDCAQNQRVFKVWFESIVNQSYPIFSMA